MEEQNNYKYDKKLRRWFHQKGYEQPSNHFTDELMSKILHPSTDRSPGLGGLLGALVLLALGLVGTFVMWPGLFDGLQVLFNLSNKYSFSSLWMQEIASLPPLVWGSLVVITVLLLFDRLIMRMFHSM